MAFRFPWQNRSLENPAVSLSDPDQWDIFGVTSSKAGQSVTPESALGVTAVWAAVRRISSSIASLPLQVYQRTPPDGKSKATGHPLYPLLHDRFNPELSSFAARELAIAHLLLFGDSFHEIERNGAGTPIALWPIHPQNVAVERVAGHKQYRVTVGGSDVVLPSESVLHIQGFSLDGCRGIYPLSIARQALGIAQATDSYAADWFNGGGQPAGVLSHPAKLGPVGTKNIRDSWKQRALSDKQRIEVLEEGMKYTPISMTPEQSQALESRQWSVTEISRLFLIPPHLIGDLSRATFSNVEQQSLDYVMHCLMPHCRRIESTINMQLMDSDHFAEFSLDGLLRGDTASRANYLSSMLDRGVYSINEARAYENMPPIPGGDVHRVALNTAPLGEDGSNEQ